MNERFSCCGEQSVNSQSVGSREKKEDALSPSPPNSSRIPSVHSTTCTSISLQSTSSAAVFALPAAPERTRTRRYLASFGLIGGGGFGAAVDFFDAAGLASGSGRAKASQSQVCTSRSLRGWRAMSSCGQGIGVSVVVVRSHTR